MMNGVYSRLLVAGLLTVGLTSCATMRGWMGHGKSGGDSVAQPAAAPVDAAEAQSTLISIVQAHVLSANNDADSNRNRLLREKPYFLKEYVEYPASAADNIAPVMQETESRTAPYRAEVELPKIRYATRLHRSRDAARADELFFRQTGTETLSYALRNGHWKRLGSVFVAEKTETNASGTWAEAVPETIPVVVEKDSSPGWFGRTWSRLFGK